MISVFLLIRFSYLSARGGQYRRTENLTLERRAALLFDEARLDARLAIFEQFCLPSLIAQPADQCRAILLTSTEMPSAALMRLQDLVRPHPQIQIVARPPGIFQNDFAEAIRQTDDAAPIIYAARMDDDDAVSRDFTEQAAGYAQARYLNHAVSFFRGIEAGRLLGRVRVWERQWMMAGVGLGHVTRSDNPETAYSLGHHLHIAKSRPTILDGRRLAFLITRHSRNDSKRSLPTRQILGRGTIARPDTLPEEWRRSFPWLTSTDWSVL